MKRKHLARAGAITCWSAWPDCRLATRCRRWSALA